MTIRPYKNTIFVLGMGMCTPIGLTLPATVTAIFAGIVRFTESLVLDDEHEPVRASILKIIEPSMTRTQRMITLATLGLKECLAIIDKVTVPIPVFLALPEERSGSTIDVSQLINSLQKTAEPEVRLDFLQNGQFASGRVAFFQALDAASNYLNTEQSPFALIAAIESLCDLKSLVQLAEVRRNLGAINIDGIIPGEGAGFALVSLSPRMPSNSKTNSSALPKILGCVLGKEQYHFYQTKPNLAQGLTKVFRKIYQHPIAGGQRADQLFSCQTGEAFWQHEFAKAYLRNPGLCPEPLSVNVIAENLGDLGAASGMIQLGVAIYKLRKRCLDIGGPRRAIIYGSSDIGELGACMVEMIT